MNYHVLPCISTLITSDYHCFHIGSICFQGFAWLSMGFNNATITMGIHRCVHEFPHVSIMRGNPWRPTWLVSISFHGFPMQQLPWVSIRASMGFHRFPWDLETHGNFWRWCPRVSTGFQCNNIQGFPYRHKRVSTGFHVYPRSGNQGVYY